jgi:hypothetical protein
MESMGAMPMHADEVEIPESLVRSLVDRQFPQWAALPLRPVTAFGTDHRLFRLGSPAVRHEACPWTRRGRWRSGSPSTET